MPSTSPQAFDPFEPARIVRGWWEAIHNYGFASTPHEAQAALNRLYDPDPIIRLHELRSRFVREAQRAGVPFERALADYQRLEQVGKRIRTALIHEVYSAGSYGSRGHMNRELDTLEGAPLEPRDAETLRVHAIHHNQPVLDEVTKAYVDASNTLHVLADMIHALTEATAETTRPQAQPENAAPRKRGRPPESDPVKDRKLCEAWERARDAEVSKEQFCEEWPTTLTPEELDAALKRERERRSRRK